MRLLVRGCDVIDGTGAPRFRGDVAVVDGRIEAVGGAARDVATDRVIDASGLVVAPGFIDLHSHSDLALLCDPQHLAKVAQGVTLEVLGQDGLSYAPVDDAALAQLRTQLAGWNGDPAGFAWDWRSVGGYLDRLDRGIDDRGIDDRGIAVNAAYLVPQGTLRMLCVGNDDRPATATELARMCALLAQGMQQGAIGMSSGLTYVPGMYADTAELIALARVVAAHGGYYSPHQRSYGAGALEAYQEMIDIAEASGCPVHLTHATMNFPLNAGRAPQLLDLVGAARARGVDVTLDSYPYLPGATTIAALLPSWAAAGGMEALTARLRDPDARRRIAQDLEVSGSDGCHGVPIDWSSIQISGVRHQANVAYVGMTIEQAARGASVAATDFCFDLLLADELATSCLMFVGHEENVRAIMRHPAHMVGSDGLLTGDRPHPRGWGTFPRYLAKYVRDERVLGLEECVAKMTGRSARRLGLTDRGLIRAGMVADLVLFDPETVADTATFDDPRRTPIGIPYVLVNGVFVIDDGVRTEDRPGRSVRLGIPRATGGV